ncbi:MAG: bifunctional riboflavin kinase/FAD synthetase [Clostridiaceae bacterium]|nr:bifunctional riboflavin kinase/FAD synthetase [Clostridiaceae bacterium]
MKVITSNEDFRFIKSNVIALGNFDGIHIAHQKVIKTALQIAKKNSLSSLVLLFDKHPISVLNDSAPKLLTTLDQKIKILEQLGVDYVYIQEFDVKFSTLEPDYFIIKILIDKLLAASIVAGFDYRFGKGAKGDTQYLKEICVKFKTDVTIVDKVDFDNEPVSASRIRNLLDEGDIEKANKLLGRRYSIEGTVVHGRGLGSKIGFPTANIDISKNIKLPGSGVYLTKSSIDNELFDSITNIGSNPTINDYLTDRISCETHVIGYSSLNLYGKEIVIQFKRKIRNEQKFDSLDQLRKAIENDILLVKKQLE